MRKKKYDHAEEEYQSLLRALMRNFAELVYGSPPFSFLLDNSDKTVHIMDEDGNFGSLPVDEYEGVRSHRENQCLACGWDLCLDFDLEAEPMVFRLLCNKCGVVHQVVNEELCILVR